MVYDELWRGARALEHLAEQAEEQHRRSRSHTTMHTASVVQAGQLFRALHLPEEAAIATAVIENNSTVATLTIYEGSGSSGRVVGIVAPSHLKRIALADMVSSLSVVASVADPAGALVIVTLSSHRWSPTQSSLT